MYKYVIEIKSSSVPVYLREYIVNYNGRIDVTFTRNIDAAMLFASKSEADETDNTLGEPWLEVRRHEWVEPDVL